MIHLRNLEKSFLTRPSPTYVLRQINLDIAEARAVIAKPTLLLADEPTGNLHSDQGRHIMELFKKLNTEGTTIIQVTHSETNATYGNRIVRLRDGWMEK